MKLKSITALLIVFIGYGCSPHPSEGEHEVEKNLSQHPGSKSGILVENGPNQGITHTDRLGTEHNYRCNTSIITNDTTIPIHLELGLSNEYNYPASCDGARYKIFLLPKELTPDTATLHNKIFDGLNNFLDRCLDKPYNLNKTLQPGEKQVVTIGRLFAKPSPCGINLNALLVKGDSLYYVSTDSSVVIPCGQISYAEN